MNFFKRLHEELGDGAQVNITVVKKADTLTVGVLPDTTNNAAMDKIKMLQLCGTPDEMDWEFFSHVKRQKAAVAGLQSNIEQVETTAKAVEESVKKDAEEKKSKAKPEKKAKEKPAAKAKKVKAEADSEDEVQDDIEENEPKKEGPAQASFALMIMLALQVTNLERVFTIVRDGKEKNIDLTDPNSELTPAEVMKFYSAQFPELTNGTVQGPVVIGDKATYKISTKAGKLG